MMTVIIIITVTAHTGVRGDMYIVGGERRLTSGSPPRSWWHAAIEPDLPGFQPDSITYQTCDINMNLLVPRFPYPEKG